MPHASVRNPWNTTRSAGEKASRSGENVLACRAAFGLKFPRADHHDTQEKSRLGNADVDSAGGHSQMLLSPTGLRCFQPKMQEHIDLLLVHDAINYTRVSKKFSVNRHCG